MQGKNKLGEPYMEQHKNCQFLAMKYVNQLSMETVLTGKI